MVEKVKMLCRQAWVPESDFGVLSVLHNLFLFQTRSYSVAQAGLELKAIF